MKKVYWLKNILDIVIWGTIIFLGIFIPLLIFNALTGFSEVRFSIDVLEGQAMESMGLAETILVFALATGYVFFLLAIFKLKKLVANFARRQFFSKESIDLLNGIGLFLGLTAFFTYIPGFLYSILNGRFEINFVVAPESFWFLLVMALFFATIGHIFREAKDLKEDNELTV